MKQQKTSHATSYESLNLGTFHRIPVDSKPVPNIINRPPKAVKNPPMIYQRLVKVCNPVTKSTIIYDIYLIPKDDSPKNQMFMSVRKIEDWKNTRLKRQQLGEFRSFLKKNLGIVVCTGNLEKYFGIIRVEVTDQILEELQAAKQIDFVDKYTSSHGYTLDASHRTRAPNKRKNEDSSEEKPSKRIRNDDSSSGSSSNMSTERMEESQWTTLTTYKLVDSLVSTWLSALVDD